MSRFHIDIYLSLFLSFLSLRKSNLKESSCEDLKKKGGEEGWGGEGGGEGNSHRPWWKKKDKFQLYKFRGIIIVFNNYGIKKCTPNT